ncbi:DNA recombination protein RmuC [Hyphococcus sp. DH-69]|uniref:DNA recombination protein RmuC n=1 Tax=Hyphococcus formosus TaxID=3143534 RepID=UPI00398AE155
MTMQMRAPSVQSETDGREGVAEVIDDPSSSVAPIIDGPGPALWAGFGAFILIFVIGLMLIIRGRVTVSPPKNREKNKNQNFFEPAGDDAEITFEGDAEPQEAWHDEHVEETEIRIEHEAPEPEPTAKQQKKSAFAGLFAKKPAKKEEPQPEFMGDMADEGFFPETPVPAEPVVAEPHREPAPEPMAEPEPAPEPETHPVMNAMALAENENRIAQIEETAKAALKRAEDAEQLANDLRRANREAEQVMTLGLRKQEAEMTDRAEALIAMEKRLSALSDEFQNRINLAAAAAQETPDPEGSVSEDHFTEFANLMGEQFDALRSAVNSAIDRLSKRIDQIPSGNQAAATPAFSGAVTSARVQLSDLLRDALPPQRYVLGHSLSSGRTADACITMPSVVAPIAIDARFPVEAFDAWQEARGRTNQGEKETELRRIVLRHIADAAEKLIAKGETADCAMMFIPSEHILSELHAHFSDLVQEGNRARIWMVAPTSLMATLHTISAVMGNTARAPVDQDHRVEKALKAINNRLAALEAREAPAQKSEPQRPEPEMPAEHGPASQPTVEYTSIYENQMGLDPVSTETKKPESKPPFPLR